jgi:GAF domain-containing protein
MLRENFCSSCMRTVYRGSNEDDSCPVCSSPLLAVGVKGEPSVQVDEVVVIPEAEEQRVAAVGRYEILDSPPDGAFDRITQIAARIFEVPIATVTIVDTERIWFKAKQGVDVVEIGRDPGLCASAVLQYDPWVVNDAASDPRTLQNPLVRGELGLRFYAGVPLTTADGYNLGTLNIIDTEPRELTDDQLLTLKQLADIVVDELELRLAALRIHRSAMDQGLRLTPDSREDAVI